MQLQVKQLQHNRHQTHSQSDNLVAKSFNVTPKKSLTGHERFFYKKFWQDDTFLYNALTSSMKCMRV